MTVSELRASLPALKAKFDRAQPFPHLVLDNFLDPALAAQVLEDFPRPEEMRTHGGDSKVLRGYQISPRDERYAPKPSLEALFAFLREKELRQWLGDLCGEQAAVLCDPDYVGAGLLTARDDGIHHIHLDRNRHPSGLFYPRLILLLYFNKDWRPEYGGALELWDAGIRRPVTVEPLFNRCVLFENTRRAYHGISDVHLPPGMARRALNFYYFTREVPAGERRTHIHDTEFFPRPEERAAYWRERGRDRFPLGLALALLRAWGPTAAVYRAAKKAIRSRETRAGSEAGRARLLETWERFNGEGPC